MMKMGKFWEKGLSRKGPTRKERLKMRPTKPGTDNGLFVSVNQPVIDCCTACFAVPIDILYSGTFIHNSASRRSKKPE